MSGMFFETHCTTTITSSCSSSNSSRPITNSSSIQNLPCVYMLNVSAPIQHSDSAAHMIFLIGPVITTMLLQQQKYSVYSQHFFAAKSNKALLKHCTVIIISRIYSA